MPRGSTANPPVALTIAGSDPIGAAGLAADLRTFAALGVHGAFALSVVTVQTTTAVHALRPVDAELLVAQIDAVLDTLEPTAAKTGLLATKANVEAVGRLAACGRMPPLVVDPVLVSSSSQRLVDDGVVRAYLDALVPHAAVLTPNAHEAALLAGLPEGAVTSLDAARRAARILAERCHGLVVVKGGHLATERTVDVCVQGGAGGELFEIEGPRIPTINDRGTGCTLSAALAAYLAMGRAVRDALREAKAFVSRALAAATDWRIGHGRGPLHQQAAAPLRDQAGG
jgi:hydroxymethylpyrimidine/phosphomethylpyrimidine kinase